MFSTRFLGVVECRHFLGVTLSITKAAFPSRYYVSVWHEAWVRLASVSTCHAGIMNARSTLQIRDKWIAHFEAMFSVVVIQIVFTTTCGVLADDRQWPLGKQYTICIVAKGLTLPDLQHALAKCSQ